MRPATIRRLLVFGVCLVGVGCLYLVPSRAGAPGRVGATSARSGLQSASAPSPRVVTAISAEPRSVRSTAWTPAVETGRHASAPPEVGRPEVVSADSQRLVIRWPEVDDDNLVGYEVWLNGFFVVTVQQARARLAWFNDSDTHVIQVRALDASGREGPPSPTLLVTRPAPSPEPPPSTVPTISTPAPSTNEAGGTQEEHS